MSNHKQVLFVIVLISLWILTACGQDGNSRGNSTNRPSDITVGEENNRGNSANAPGHNKTPGVPPGQTNRPDKPEKDDDGNGDEENREATAVVIPDNNPSTTNPLKERFAAIQPADDGTISITITDDEFNQALQTTLSQSDQPSPIENPQVAFTSGNIILTGNVTEPVSGQLTVTFRPYITNGILQFEVVSATLGDVRVPALLLTSAQNTLNSTFNDAMSNMSTNITLQDVIIEEGTMTIVGSTSP